MTPTAHPPKTSPRRGVGSGVAAIGIVFVTTFAWWLVSGNGPQGPRGTDATYAVPAVPTSTGQRDESVSVRTSGPELTNRNGVRIDGFSLETPTRLVLSYTTEDPECAGR